MRSPASCNRGSEPERDRDGQATVELALSLPLLFMFLLGHRPTGRDRSRSARGPVAASEAARAAAVAISSDAAAQAAADHAVSLRPLLVAARVAIDTVIVTVSHVTHTDVPLIGALLPDITVNATATMALEPP